MLLKQFIKENELNYFLSVANITKCNGPAYGSNVFTKKIYEIHGDFFNELIENGKILFNKILPDYIYYDNESVIVKIFNNGWVSLHDDLNDKDNMQNTNLVIMLQNATNGGNIIYGNKKIIMQAGDAFILNESVPHGVETVKSDLPFIAIVLWFKKSLSN